MESHLPEFEVPSGIYDILNSKTLLSQAINLSSLAHRESPTKSINSYTLPPEDTKLEQTLSEKEIGSEVSDTTGEYQDTVIV